MGEPCLCAWPTPTDAEYPGTILEFLPDGLYGFLYRMDDSAEMVTADRLRKMPDLPPDESFLPPGDGEIKVSWRTHELHSRSQPSQRRASEQTRGLGSNFPAYLSTADV